MGEPITEVEFPTCIATERRCNKYINDLGSPVHNLKHLPRSWRKHMESEPIVPLVSKAISWKIYKYDPGEHTS